MKKIKQNTYLGAIRFEFYISQLEQLLNKAARQKNPALWLYRNNARTPLFMLEGLAKMYSDFHNRKIFMKIKEQSKLLEDVLGSIDYYDAFAKEFSNNKKIPAGIVSYMQAQTREKEQSFNELLKEKEWLGEASSRIGKIRSKLAKIDWLKEKDEVKAIENFYGKSIYEIVEFVNGLKFHFTSIESEVHELRRKLRWLSIYPQALRGCIQLSKSKNTDITVKKYLTKEITTSPFNKLPDAGNSKYFLLLDQNNFLALSWMIAELGILKDNGLRVIAIKEALQQTTPISDTEALKKAYQLTGTKQSTLPQILEKTGQISRAYFNEHFLENMILGISEIEK